jgi:hypothetical protein
MLPILVLVLSIAVLVLDRILRNGRISLDRPSEHRDDALKACLASTI